MSEKMFNTRIIHKHDTAENWEKATGFIPMSGELVIYDVDENNKYARMKIGDGVTKISDLPFTKEIALDANNIIKQENLPEGYPYLSYGKVLPKTTIQIEQGYGVIYERVLAGSGLTYQINYNGEFYECIGANKKVDGIEAVFLGNSAYVGEGEEDTGEPFALLILKGKDVDTYGFGAMVAVNDENITAIELSIEGAIVQTIDPVYLPSIELSLQNLVDGKALGSMRAIGTREEDADYSLGSHATSFGMQTYASGDYAFSEGRFTHARGEASHAEGALCTAYDDYCHAEGYMAKAYRKGAHSEGMGTIIKSEGGHAQGRYNIMESDSVFYAHIVGNGTLSNRSNAHTLDWDGNAWYQGDVYVGSTSGIDKDEGSKKLATEEYVDNAVQEIYKQPEEPTDAPEGALWVDTDEESSSGGSGDSGGGGFVETDSVPTSGSSNPVSSGGVYTALSNKQDKLTFDSTPTENSSNPVASGGVYTEVNSAKKAASLAMPGSLKWDGIVGDRECVVLEEGSIGEGVNIRYAFVHVSDYVPEILALMVEGVPAEERILPALCSIAGEGVIETQVQVADDMLIMGEEFFYVPTDGYSLEGMVVFPKQGWYLIGVSYIIDDIEFPLMYVNGILIEGLTFPDTNGGSDKYFEKNVKTTVTDLGDTLTWDGVSGVNIGAKFGLTLVRIADCDLTQEELADADITLTNSANNVGDIRVESVAGLTIIGDSNNDVYVFISHADNANLEGIILPTKGIYFLNNGSVYCTSLTINGYNFTNTTPTTQKVIKTEHLPEALRFGEITTETRSDTLTWDGNTEGLVSVVMSDGTALPVYKVSDAVPTVNDMSANVILDMPVLEGHTIVSHDENFTQADSFSLYTAGIKARQPDGVIVTYSAYVVLQDMAGIDFDGISFPEAGIYFVKANDMFINSLTIPGYNGFVTSNTELVKIDPKYLPDDIGGGISSSEVDAKIEAAIGAAIAASY